MIIKLKHTMKNQVLKSVLILVASAGMASADTTVTFDDLPMMTGPATINNGYQGLDWSNFSWSALGTGRGLATSGFSKGTVSGPDVAFNNSSDPSVLSSSTPFNLDSADLTGAWRSGLQLEVKGFKPGDSTPDYDSIYTLTSTGPTLINFDFLGVDKVEFSSCWRSLYAHHCGGCRPGNFRDGQPHAGSLPGVGAGWRFDDGDVRRGRERHWFPA